VKYSYPDAVGVFVLTGKIRDDMRTFGVVVGPGMVELAVVDELELPFLVDAYDQPLGTYGPVRVGASELHRLAREARVGNPRVEERRPGRRSKNRSLRDSSKRRGKKSRNGLSASIGDHARLKKRLEEH